MSVFDRVVVGVDGTDFGFEALHQTLALSPPGQAVLAVTALDTAIAGYAGFQVDYYKAQLEEEAERARARASRDHGRPTQLHDEGRTRRCEARPTAYLR